MSHSFESGPVTFAVRAQRDRAQIRLCLARPLILDSQRTRDVLEAVEAMDQIA
jgi:hypothetical protein